MKILYVGDVMGEAGMRVLSRVLPGIKRTKEVDLVIAQAENVTDGKGLSKADFQQLKGLGVDFCTGGNWTLHLDEINDYLGDPQQPVIRPANYPAGIPGRGWKFAHTSKGDVLVISLLGSIVGKDADKPVDNPLKVVDEILKQTQHQPKVATIVNFHGDYSSEKVVIGYYLDGRVSAVLGDHWHVPSGDAMVLPQGTAHMSDVGMCGSLHSSLGVKTEVIIDRWRDGKVRRNELEHEGPLQFNAALITVDETTGLATSIEAVRQILDGIR
jgi:hypothetical protein